ncbi:sugar transferase [Rhodoferax koreense]|uniref:Sugar transferase n=1 Tax=Rhodoferax koreensis TaxID=1842727 RepID=A0A1P8K4D6_9BURK|nr:TIGR03087 family PEP-CTERM/XrtA system glycosyltransferase [Rhodoferax koreense]APW40857.1 sugar transferase [Rhodoferax koreense]
MGNVLYLAHRLPFPPNKGDKVRSYHLLKHLAAKHRVFLGTFVDDPEDEVHVETVRGFCAEVYVARLSPRLAKIRSLAGLLRREALSLGYYRDAGLSAWCRRLATDEQIDAAVVFSSPMAQYADLVPDAAQLVDFVDVDSAKWTQYASAHSWPMSWLYRREGERLLAYEAAVAAKAERSFFVTENEATLFRGLASAVAGKVEALSNGVDAAFFAPDSARVSPFPSSAKPVLVFTGAMDYWPNIDGVTWFVAEVLPELLRRWPELRFYIVGRSPTPAVEGLASSDVVVTGTVPDVRPYLQHATVVVAPLRVARGIQNKILEAMAMARPVVASSVCVKPIGASEGAELLAARDAEDFIAQIDSLLHAPGRADAIGRAGQTMVQLRYSWDAHLAGIDRHLDRFMPENEQ